MSKRDPEYSRVARQKAILKKAKKRNNPVRKFFRRLFFSFFIIIEFAIVLGATLFFIYAKSAPTLTEAKLQSSGSTTIYDANDHKIMSLGSENRRYISENKIPQQLKNAIVSIEDRRFYQHHGIDPIRIVGAAIANITGSSGGLQGGSTLDQQLIKLSYFSTKRSDQTLKRKAQEAWMALKLDNSYSKDQILTFYINKVFMGFGTYGMQTASYYYFNKPLKDLNLAQTALIAGIPNAPTDYNPYSNQKLALKRRNEVLDAMLANKKITSAQAAQAKSEPITYGVVQQRSTQTVNSNEKIADSYIKQVIQEVKKKGYDPYTSSLKIYTNLDMNIQKKLYQIANTDNYINYPNNNLQIASTIVNPNNGKIVAMIGGRQVGNVTFGLNRAVQTDRTNGSTAKPLMDYGPAIEYLSWATYHKLKDTKYIYPGTNIQLYDFDHQYQGSITMRSALTQSRNIPAIRALQAVGITRAQNFISKLGFKYKKTLEFQNGIGLYSSTLQNAAAYAAFANGGTYYKPTYVRSIETNDGTVHNYSSSGKQVMQSSTAYMITDMLKDVLTSSSGTGRSANISGLYEAGKTGTNSYPSNVADKFPSDADMDSWFNGYTKHYSMSVWVGYDHPYETGNYLNSSSVKIAQYIYKYAMSYMSTGKTNTDWKRPSNVYVKYVNGVRELYLAGSPDKTSSDSDSSSKTSSSSSSNSSSSESSSLDSSSSISSIISSSSVFSSQSSSSSSENSSQTSSSTPSSSTSPSSSSSSSSSSSLSTASPTQ